MNQLLNDPEILKAIGGAILLGLGLLIETLRRHIKTVRNQVQNSHSTNLRDDVDRVIEAVDEIRDLVRTQATDMRQLRDDLNTERKERLAVELRVDELRLVPAPPATA